jgi:hypothetical protein
MRGYGVVTPQFWIGDTGKALKAGGYEAVMVGLYLMTSPHANMLGLYYVPEIYIAHETGLGIEGASKGLRGCIQAGFCSYDSGSEMVWVHEMARYQVGEALDPKDKRSKGVQNDYDALPSNPYLAEFFDKYGNAFCMTKKREPKCKPTSPIKAPSKVVASQDQDQDQDQEQGQEHKDSVGQQPDGDESGDKVASDSKTIEGIFDYWRKTMDSPKSKLDDKRRGVIRRALKAGYSPRDLCRAIQGCALTPHNQGVNERGQKYLGIHVCLKDADQIDRFMANAKAPPVAPTKPSSGQIPGWWKDDELAKQQGALVGVNGPHSHESRDAWHARIRAAIDNGGKPTAPVAPTPAPAAATEQRVQMTDEQKAANRAALQAALKGTGVKVVNNGMSME